MVTTVKICGIRDLHGAMAARDAGATFGGLLFVPGRRRSVDVDLARALIPHLGDVEPVGVFLDAPLEDVRRTAEALGLRTVQLHGAEPPRYAEALARDGLRIIRAVSAGDGGAPLEARLSPFVATSLAFLVDGAAPGSGRPASAAQVGDDRLGALATRLGRPVWLAGGLTPENVRAALEATGATGADVASGVEVDGEQNPARVRAFVRAAKDERAYS